MLVPLLIFTARIIDVSIGTLRFIFTARGYRFLAPLMGFFEATIWLLAIRQILNHINNPLCIIAYGLGFAVGNFVGISLDDRLSLGTVMVRIVPKTETQELGDLLREEGFGVSLVDIEGMSGKQKMLLTVVMRKNLGQLMEMVQRYNPQAFITVEDVKTAKEGYFLLRHSRRSISRLFANAIRTRK